MEIILKGEPKFCRRIDEMKVGEIGYIVPWAYNPKTNKLDLNFTFSKIEYGTEKLKVTRIDVDTYELDFENTSFLY